MRIKRGHIISIVIVLIIICAGCIIFIYRFGEEEEQKALVSFYNSDDSYFNVSCEIADSDRERSRGLMRREYLPEDRGMLFIYDSPESVSFWMKNTLIPLDIIFVAENSTVLNVEEADVQLNIPDSELIRYKSHGQAKWVVEINQGLSARNGVSVGSIVDIEYTG